MTAKLVPVALLTDIEATWREASAFSNTANNLIERGLPELRALLAAPDTEHQDPIALFEAIIGKDPEAFLREPVYQVTESEVREFAQQVTADRKRKHLRSCQIAIGKSQLAKERLAELIVLREEATQATEQLFGQEQVVETLREQLVTVQRGKDNADLALTTQTKNKERYKQRAIAAEQRNLELIALLRKVQPCISTQSNGTKSPLRAEIDAALKPTEPGPKQATANEFWPADSAEQLARYREWIKTEANHE